MLSPQNPVWLQKSRLNQARGTVVVMALFMMTFIAVLSTLMLSQVMRHIERTTLLAQMVQARFIAKGSVALAMDTLRLHWEKQRPGQPIDRLPLHLPSQNVNGYRVESVIQDAQALFNLNGVTAGDDSSKMRFMRLLQTVDPQLSISTKETIANALVDWIKPLPAKRPLDDDFLSWHLAYSAAHHPLVKVSELLFLKGMTPRLYQRLKPYVIALPVVTTINVATASAPVLMTLDPHLSFAIATQLAMLYAQNPPLMTNTFLEDRHNQPLQINSALITVVSQYFIVETTVSIQQQVFVWRTLLERTISDRVKLTILWQSMDE